MENSKPTQSEWLSRGAKYDKCFAPNVYSNQMNIVYSLFKKLISFFVLCFGIEYWIKLVNFVPGISAELRNRLILSPKPIENVRRLNYLGLKYYSNTDDSLNQSARIDFETWEYRSRHVFYELSKSADLIIDIGAYSGVYSLIGASGSSTSRIFAFEPNPTMREVLEKNVELNGFASRIAVEEFALSDRKGSSALTVGGDTSMAMLHPISSTDALPTHPEITVKMTTLDEYNFEAHSVLMKVDIEGSEIAFLHGASRTIKTLKPTILMEALTNFEFESQSDFLTKLGYGVPVCMGSDTGDERNYLWTVSK